MHKARHAPLLVIGAALLISLSCSGAGSSGQASTRARAKDGHYEIRGGRAMSFALDSTAFADGGAIPGRYTCSGADVSPALSWTGVPDGTRSLALIAEDPDAPGGTWTHWVIWNVPAEAASLPEGVPPSETLEDGARQGRNDFRRIGYGGPCPPPGKPHRYFFHLYALDATLALKAGAARSELERAMKGHVLSKAERMGKYGR
jgi:Raf kinase inhibitor-like YbhB/YbcL family protein